MTEDAKRPGRSATKCLPKHSIRKQEHVATADQMRVVCSLEPI